MTLIYLRNVGTEDDCWVPCAKGDPGAVEFTRAPTLVVNLTVCLDMLREACSPFVPSSGRDNEWLARRDRVVTNAERALSPAEHTK